MLSVEAQSHRYFGFKEILRMMTHFKDLVLLFSTVPFCLMLNVHFWNYYVPLCACVRKLSFSNFDSNFWLIFTRHPCSIFFIQLPKLTFINFCRQKNRTKGKVQHPSSCSFTQPAHPHNISPPSKPPTYPLPSYDSHYTVPFHSAAHFWRKFPLVLHQNNFTALTSLLLFYFRDPYRSS